MPEDSLTFVNYFCCAWESNGPICMTAEQMRIGRGLGVGHLDPLDEQIHTCLLLRNYFKCGLA